MNKFLQWFLSPAAYMVWVSLGNQDEWNVTWRKDVIYNRKMKLMLNIERGGSRLDGDITTESWITNVGNCRGDIGPFLGPVERRILWRRVKKLLKRIKWQEKNAAKLEAQKKIIERMMHME